MMKPKYAVFSALALVVLYAVSACQALGVPSLKSFNERLAGGYTSVTAVRQTATVLLNAQAISIKDAENVQKTADTAREGLDIATQLGNTPQGQDKLSTTLVILTQAQTYLNSRKPK